MSCKKNDLCATLAFLTLLTLAVGCQSESRRDLPDVSHIEIEAPIQRFEQDLFRLDTSDMEASLARLQEAYPELSPIFFSEILGADDPYFAPQGATAFIRGFIEYPAVRQLYDTVQIVYGDMADIQEEFEQAFRFFKYYFPEERSPSVATFLSEYSIGAFVYGDNDLAVGLDFFLGEDYPYQRYNPTNPNFSAYLTRTFNRSHLVSKALQPLLEDLSGRPAGNRLLDLMIHNGKKLYVLDHLLPLTPDSVKLEVTPAQVKWLKENEREMWAFFIKEELLYSSETKKIRKYVEYSPHSPNMPAEAPGRTANWMGWQIVKAYMQRYPETSFAELFALSDAQAILDASNYKPRR